MWESGFGIKKENTWVSLEKLTSKTIYDILIQKRNTIKAYTPNPAHEVIYKIEKYLTPEERNYWWHLNHNLVSVKKQESKYKRDAEGRLTQPTCTMCNKADETRDHYNNTCEQMIKFRQAVAQTTTKADFTEQEWSLKIDTKDPLVSVLIAKARCALHCERCNVDHKRRRRLNLKVVLNRTLQRMEPATRIHEAVMYTQEKKSTPTNT